MSFLLLIIILPSFHKHLSLSPEVRDTPDQAAYFHTIGLEVGGFICLTWLLAVHRGGKFFRVTNYCAQYPPVKYKF
jgi:hypothetical protein